VPAVNLLVLAQRQADDVDVVFLDSALHHRTPPATDVEKRHAGLQFQLVEREIDLRHLRVFERHVVALEERTTVCAGRVLKGPEENVGQVVVGLDLLEKRPHRHRARLAFRHLYRPPP
jgi:hypothetical protein